MTDDARDFYGREYWYSGQARTPGLTNIEVRARTDLFDRCPQWLATLLKYKQPPGRILELGSSHGGFVALLRTAGFDASGLELSPGIVELAERLFGVPVLSGPLEDQSIPERSLDAVVLMDVLEHLENPLPTIRRAAACLKADGVLLIQTPEYPGTDHDRLAADASRFLEMLKPDEHLHLFSRSSLQELLAGAGVAHCTFEPAVFSHYDMFVAAGREPLTPATPDAIAAALSRTPGGRLALGFLDLAEQRDAALQRAAVIGSLEADVAHLKEQLTASEADRAARLEVIERQGAEVSRQGAELSRLHARVAALEENEAALRIRTEELQAERRALDHRLGEAADILHTVRGGTVLRVARVLRPEGADAALARATAILEGAVQHAAAAPVPWSQEPPVSAPPGSAAPATDDLCARIRDPKTTDPFHYTAAVVAEIVSGLRARGVHLEEIAVDPAEYRAYFERAAYTARYPDYYSFNLQEKSLEHFLAAKLLALGPDDVYIDIASEHSPVPEIYARLFGCVTYRQDLAYPAGLEGDRIGGDAAAMPVPDGFASRMALHCSFEHFEGGADARFVREAERVLRPGGRVCVAPLYLWNRFGVLTDPAVAVAEQVGFDDGAVVYCKPGWGNRHGRLYDPAQLDARIRANLGGLQLTVYRILNATDVDPSCYIQFAAVLRKP